MATFIIRLGSGSGARGSPSARDLINVAGVATIGGSQRWPASLLHGRMALGPGPRRGGDSATLVPGAGLGEEPGRHQPDLLDLELERTQRI